MEQEKAIKNPQIYEDQQQKVQKKKEKKGDEIENIEEEKLSFKEKRRQELLVGLKSLSQQHQTNKSEFIRGLGKLFKESNINQIVSICDEISMEHVLEFAEQAIQDVVEGRQKKEDNTVRSLGGAFFHLVKVWLENEDPMLQKKVFSRPTTQKQKRNIQKREKRSHKKQIEKSQKQQTLIQPNQSQKQENIFAIFNKF